MPRHEFSVPEASSGGYENVVKQNLMCLQISVSSPFEIICGKFDGSLICKIYRDLFLIVPVWCMYPECLKVIGNTPECLKVPKFGHPNQRFRMKVLENLSLS
jgi:hypothetical protein